MIRFIKIRPYIPEIVDKMPPTCLFDHTWHAFYQIYNFRAVGYIDELIRF